MLKVGRYEPQKIQSSHLKKTKHVNARAQDFPFPREVREIREIKIHVYAKRQTWICTTWPGFSLIFRLLFIASTQK